MKDDDDLLFTIGATAPLLDCAEVDAICIKVELTTFRPYRQGKLVFHLKVLEPAEFEGTLLQLYARLAPQWQGKPPIASKLWKIAAAATGGNLKRGQKITKSLFLRKIFRCRLKVVGEAGARYSTVDTILERLAG